MYSYCESQIYEYWITGLLEFFFAGRSLLWHFQWVNISFLFLLIVHLVKPGISAPLTPITLKKCLSYKFLKVKTNQWGGIFNVYWQTVPSFNRKKFFLISSVELRFILHVENLVSRWAVSTDLVNHVPSLTLSCLWRIFQVWIKSPLMLTSFNWSRYEVLWRPDVIFKTRFWTLSSSSISDLSQGDQAWTHYSRRGRTYTL